MFSTKHWVILHQHQEPGCSMQSSQMQGLVQVTQVICLHGQHVATVMPLKVVHAIVGFN